LQNNKKNKDKATQKSELPFTVELALDDNQAFYDILLEAIDTSFLAFGEQVKTTVYLYLENSMGIKKTDIPFRIDDFQNALEKLLGIGTRYLEILIIKNLYEQIKIECKKNIPRWAVPDLTFQEYIRLVKKTYETSN
jgi:hypothetical protein